MSRARRAEVRERLIDAATALFARQGIQATSIEQIAAEAGFTRGAVYSNFADKDDLVAAALDRRVARSMAEIEETYERDHDPDAFYQALYERSQHRETTEEDRVLFVEFWLYALRNPEIRPKLAPRFAARRAAIAHLIERQFADLDVPLPADPSQLATALLALDEGLALHRRIDPEGHPDTLFFELLSKLLQGAMALAREEAKGKPGRDRRV